MEYEIQNYKNFYILRTVIIMNNPTYWGEMT